MFDNTTGVISGTPTEIAGPITYMITASNDDGSGSVYVTISVQDVVYDTNSEPVYMVNGSTIDSIAPISTINNSQYEIEPELPEGLMFGATNGTIYGTPTEPMPLTNFTIYANSSLFNSSYTNALEVLGDSDGDGEPDALPADYTGTLVEDTDDDGDGFSDEQEAIDGTDPLSRFSCKSGCFSFDVDQSFSLSALADGLLVMRHLLEFSGDTLAANATDTSATRSSASDISSYLTEAQTELDIDGNGEVGALTDGLLLIRYLFDFRGESLISNAVDANATRKTAAEIEAYIQARIPGA